MFVSLHYKYAAIAASLLLSSSLLALVLIMYKPHIVGLFGIDAMKTGGKPARHREGDSSKRKDSRRSHR